MSTPPRPDNYPTEPSRLAIYPSCNTPIHSLLWYRHIATLRTLEQQASKLGLWEVAYELSLEIARHISFQLKVEQGVEP